MIYNYFLGRSYDLPIRSCRNLKMINPTIMLCLINTKEGIDTNEIVKHYQVPKDFFDVTQIKVLEDLTSSSPFPSFLQFLLEEGNDEWLVGMDMDNFTFVKLYNVFIKA